jgi:hypothetical protein
VKKDNVTIDASVWADDTGKFMRFSIIELGNSIQVEMLHVEQEKVDEQAVAMIQLVKLLPTLMAESLESALADWASEDRQ